MKAAEILRALANLVDMTSTEPVQEPEVVVAIDIEQQDTEQVDQIAKLAGISRASTTPDIQIAPIEAAYPAGDDIHKSKHPADQRSDSVSMYPNLTAGK